MIYGFEGKIIMNKKHEYNKAAALRYDPSVNSSPEITAKGVRLIADDIIALAKKYNIPLYQDPALVEQLINLDIGSEIPPELYEAAAVVLAFVYKLDRQAAKELKCSNTDKD